jgi:hypothetical protein
MESVNATLVSVTDTGLTLARPEPDMFDKFGGWLEAKINTFKSDRALQKLQHEIAEIIKLANAHHTKGVKKGDPVYAALYRKALAFVTEYSSNHNCDCEPVLNSSPALRELKGWAEYDQAEVMEKNIKMYAFIAILAVIGISAGLGIMGGIIHDFYWLTTLGHHIP